MDPDRSSPQQRQADLQDLAARFGLRILYAFGSRAREAWAWRNGEAVDLGQGDADLDVGVLGPRPLGIDDKVTVSLALEDLTGARRVDLVDLTTADPFLAANVIRGERLWAADAHAADEYDLYVLRRAGDLIPLERERLALVLGKEL